MPYINEDCGPTTDATDVLCGAITNIHMFTNGYFKKNLMHSKSDRKIKEI
ncbi:MAG TPA: hypothetical protein VE076_08995 [Nitrososphaeraceae archaeon]|nr:hypothetical protein [Nitrososphaeraceae archaeon]